MVSCAGFIPDDAMKSDGNEDSWNGSIASGLDARRFNNFGRMLDSGRAEEPSGKLRRWMGEALELCVNDAVSEWRPSASRFMSCFPSWAGVTLLGVPKLELAILSFGESVQP